MTAHVCAVAAQEGAGGRKQGGAGRQCGSVGSEAGDNNTVLTQVLGNPGGGRARMGVPPLPLAGQAGKLPLLRLRASNLPSSCGVCRDEAGQHEPRAEAAGDVRDRIWQSSTSLGPALAICIQPWHLRGSGAPLTPSGPTSRWQTWHMRDGCRQDAKRASWCAGLGNYCLATSICL